MRKVSIQLRDPFEQENQYFCYSAYKQIVPTYATSSKVISVRSLKRLMV